MVVIISSACFLFVAKICIANLSNKSKYLGRVTYCTATEPPQSFNVCFEGDFRMASFTSSNVSKLFKIVNAYFIRRTGLLTF